MGEPVVGTRVGDAANGQSGESSRSAPLTVQTDTIATMTVFSYRIYMD